jgi:hypothetical protein
LAEILQGLERRWRIEHIGAPLAASCAWVAPVRQLGVMYC